MSLTTQEKIELVSARYDPEAICDHLELTSTQILEAFGELLEENWFKFDDIETDIEDLGGYGE